MGQRTHMNTSINVVSNVFTQSMVKVSKSCSSTSVASQNVSASNVGGDVNFENISQAASITINFECIQSSENQQQVLDNVKDSVAGAIKANTSGVGFSGTTINTYINQVTNACMTVDMQDFASCAQSNWTIQNVSATNVAGNVTFKNVSQSMIVNATGKCLQSNQNLSDACTALDKQLGLTAESEQSGVDPFGMISKMFGQYTTMVMVCCVVAVIGSVGSSAIMFMGK